jgi:transcriptional regulator with XRE-family HTH domain
MTFGERVRALRQKHELTQHELAGRLQEAGVQASFTYISKIENGKTEFTPSEEFIRGLAAVLGEDAELLLDAAGKFDQRALQEVVAEMPEAGVLLRRLQAGRISRRQIRRLLAEVGAAP